MDRPPPPAQQRDLFLGRAAELERLAGAFWRAQRGAARVFLVGGPSGIGKTALVQRFLDALPEPEGPSRPSLVLRARCYERETAPFRPLGALMRDLVRRLGEVPAARKGLPLAPELVRMFPAFATLRSGVAWADTPVPGEPLQVRERAIAGLRALMTHLLRHASLLMFVDDLHWADADSLAVLEALVGEGGAPGLLLLSTYRPEELEATAAFRGFLERHGAEAETHVSLAPLPAAEAEDLARGLLAREVSPDSASWAALVETIVRESEGSPLLVEELVRFLRRRLDRPHAPGDPESIPLESLELDQVLLTRIAELPERVQTLLELIAVAGDPVPLTVALSAMGGEVAAAEWITRLRSESLVRRYGPDDRDEVDTLHDRIREALVASLPAERRVAHHRALAEAMRRFDPERAEFLAKHWRAAGDPVEARHYLEEVARRAARRLAFGQAAELLRQALYLEAEPGAAARLGEALGDALANLGRLAEAAEAYLAAAEAAPAEQGRTLRLRAGEQLLRGGHMARGFDVLGQVLAETGYPLSRTPRRALFSILRNRAWIALRGLKLGDRQAGQSELDALYAAAAYMGVVDTIHGADLQNRYLRRAATAGSPLQLGLALVLEGTFQATRGAKAFSQARALLDRSEPLVREHGEPWRLGMVHMGRGMIEYFAGQWKQARDLLRRAEETFLSRGFGVAWEVATTRNWLGFSLFQLGELPELLARYDAQVEEALRAGNHYAAGSLRTRLNVLWAIRGDEGRVREDVSNLLETYPKGSYQVQHFWHLHGRSDGLLYLGEGAAALALLDAEWPLLKRAQLHRVHFVRAEIQSLVGRAAVSAATRTEDPRARAALLKRARAAARALRRGRLPFTDTWAAIVEAAVAQQSAGREAGAAAAEEALRVAEAAGCTLHAQALRCVVGELRPDAQGAGRAALAWLRERSVASPRRFVALLAPGLGAAPEGEAR